MCVQAILPWRKLVNLFTFLTKLSIFRSSSEIPTEISGSTWAKLHNRADSAVTEAFKCSEISKFRNSGALNSTKLISRSNLTTKQPLNISILNHQEINRPPPPQYFRLEIYRGFPYIIFDFLDIREFLTNFGNSGFWKFIGDFLIYFSTFWI